MNILTNQPAINIGHAGSGFNYLISPFNPLPPNSFASLTQALENGAEGVEVDVQITADSVLVLYHDLTIENIPGLSGEVASNHSRDLIGASVKCGFPYDLFQDEKIISFRKWISYAMQQSEIPYLQIDLKTGPGQSDESRSLLLQQMNSELLDVNYPLNKVIVISVDRNLLVQLKTMNPDLPLALEPGNFEEGLSWAIENKCRFLILDHRKLTVKMVQSAHEKGVGIIAFGGKARSSLVKIIDMRPVFIQSNNVSLVHELLQ